MFTSIGLLVFVGSVRGASVSKIVNGVDTDIESFPYQISLQIDGEHHCGGSIISTTRILTAAHCTYQYPISRISIRAGSSIREQGGQVRAVSEKHQHPEYEFPLRNDVVVFVLMEALVLDNKIEIIPLAVDSNQPVGSYAVVTGWGLTANDTFATVLQMLKQTKFNDTICIAEFEQFEPGSQLCYGSRARTSPCSADSGGPLVYEGLQIGIVSYGTSACDGSKPTGYSNVAHFLKFIQSHM